VAKATLDIGVQLQGASEAVRGIQSVSDAELRALRASAAANEKAQASQAKSRKETKDTSKEQDGLNQNLKIGAGLLVKFGAGFTALGAARGILKTLNDEVENTIRLQNQAAGSQKTFATKKAEFIESTLFNEANTLAAIDFATTRGAKLGKGGAGRVLDAIQQVGPKVGEGRLPEIFDQLDTEIAAGGLQPGQEFGTKVESSIMLGDIFGSDRGAHIQRQLIAEGGADVLNTRRNLPKLLPALKLAEDAESAALLAGAFQITTGAGQLADQSAGAVGRVGSRLGSSNVFKTFSGKDVTLAGDTRGEKLVSAIEQVEAGTVSSQDVVEALAKEGQSAQSLVANVLTAGKEALLAKAAKLLDVSKPGGADLIGRQTALTTAAIPEGVSILTAQEQAGQLDVGQAASTGALKGRIAEAAATTRAEVGLEPRLGAGGVFSRFTGIFGALTGRRSGLLAGNQASPDLTAGQLEQLEKDLTLQDAIAELSEQQTDTTSARGKLGFEQVTGRIKTLDDLAQFAVQNGLIDAGRKGFAPIEEALLGRAGATAAEQGAVLGASGAGDTAALEEVVSTIVDRLQKLADALENVNDAAGSSGTGVPVALPAQAAETGN